LDRNTITGLVLIFFTMIAWAYFSMPTQEELEQRKAEQAQQAQQARQDSIAAVQADSQAQNQEQAENQTQPTDTAASESTQITETEDEDAPQAMGMFSRASQTDTSSITVETPLYRTEFTNLGAGPASFTLKNYQTWDHDPIQLIGGDTTRSAYTVGFLTNENYNVETDQLLFEQLTEGSTLNIQEGDSTQLKYALNISDNKRILYTYTFRADTYEIDLDIQFEGLKPNIIGSNIEFGWQPRLNLTEKDREQDATLTSAYVYTGGEREQLLLSESGSKEENYNGTVDWVASRTKFFAQIIKSDTPTEGALLTGQVTDGADQAGAVHHYQAYLQTRIPESGTNTFRMFVGPLDYHSLEDYDESTYGMVDVGYSWTRWFADPLVRWVIIPFFDFFGDYMNMGLAIILFGFLVKMILYPFTKKSYKSMAAMKDLQPQMKEIQEKYEDDPQKQQKATMKLYKEAKVNPLGGCLPNLLQLPILITLWRFFQNSILIRQEEFLWAGDLSAPDYILSLPFEIPFLGDQLAGFVLLMSAAMVVQSRLTGGMSGGGGAGPGAGVGKMMMYFLPIMLLFVFNNFAAGLSLYYLIYNVVSIGQQLLINKQIEQEKDEVEVQPA
jgi:YidC/Oxa1 family membrane protein insertase